MKLSCSTVLATAAGAMVLSSHSHAAYLGLALEFTDPYFSEFLPYPEIRDAWNAGPVNQFDVYRLYANFDSGTPSDRVNAVAGVPGSPLFVNLVGGTFHNYADGH